MITDLRPTGDPGLDTVAYGVEGDIARQLIDEIRALGAWADQAHVAGQHTVQLRQLVNADLADQPADTGHAIIVGGRPAGLAIAFRVLAHTAKLDDIEQAAVETYPLLPVKN